ncbi:hypothetical protein [Acinetobacter gerneri]|uniref:hypothetical protein n=1 Tax=Acinetobacter gerneri TaxID=202952 RepID=UPI0028A809D2|nr:hypothetical protein [Acinetobacter gerneri]
MAWDKKPTDFAHSIQDDAEKLIKNIASDAITMIIPMTPVMDGTARSNYRVSLNSPDSGYDLKQFDYAGQATIVKSLQFIATNAKLGTILYIQNNVPYINRLENGWSKQAPQGMFGLTFHYISSKYK